MAEIKGYITNLGKYNEGELIGEWITFPISEEELKEVYSRIGINEYYEEIFFTDWDCDAPLDLGEYISIDEVNDIAEQIADVDENLFKAALEFWNIDEVLENIDNICIYSDIDNDYDLGYYYAVEVGCLDIPEHLINYIDFESYGRDIRFELNGGFSSFGWVEMC